MSEQQIDQKLRAYVEAEVRYQVALWLLRRSVLVIQRTAAKTDDKDVVTAAVAISKAFSEAATDVMEGNEP